MGEKGDFVDKLLADDEDSTNQRWLGETLGMIATFCFTLQYMPQAWKNYQRKSCRGFSSTGIIIKLVGAAFLMVNSYLLGEVSSVVLYGVFNVVQHTVFMIQLMYMEDPRFFSWVGFPLIPYLMGLVVPWTIPLTNTIKPGAQVFSHLPQLHLCYKLKTTGGCSLETQHLNIVGGACGMIMCLLIPPKSVMTYFLYSNSMFQALSLYALAFWFDGYRFTLRLPAKPGKSTPTIRQPESSLSGNSSMTDSDDIEVLIKPTKKSPQPSSTVEMRTKMMNNSQNNHSEES